GIGGFSTLKPSIGRDSSPKIEANLFIFLYLSDGRDSRTALLLPFQVFRPATLQRRCLPRALPFGNSPRRRPDSAPLFRWSHQTATRATGKSPLCPPAHLVPAARRGAGMHC